MRVLLSLLFLMLSWTPLAWATITVDSISGVSLWDNTVPTAQIIYGAHPYGSSRGALCTGDGTSTCNSCLGDSTINGGLYACSRTSIYPGLSLTVRFRTTTTGATASNVFAKINNNTVTPRTTPSVGTDGSVTASYRWSDLCNASSPGSDCRSSTSFDFTFGVDTGTADSITVKVRVKAVDVDDATSANPNVYQQCPPATPTTPAGTGIADQGFCYFEAYPGDAKIYANELGVPQGYPASTGSVEYAYLLFFYAPQAGGESDSAILAKVNNSLSPKRIAVNRTSSPPTSDNRIDGLSNEVRYCFVMASEDQSTMISYFTPLSAITDTDQICAAPSQVVGLLDDKNCFIATAAFGSDLAPEVHSFREFRNRFLLTHPWGEAFVKFYYKHSPYFANLIAENELARSLVRGVLWPLLIFAQLSVQWGVIPTALLSAFVLASLLLGYQHLRQRRFRGEA